MIPKEAAAIIGCTTRHVCLLCQTGKLEAKRKVTPLVARGYVWNIPAAEVRRFRDNRPKRGRKAQ